MAHFLDPAGHQLVSEAVAEAERHTAGEIVTVLAERTDGYTDIVLAWAALASFTAMSLFAALPQPFMDLWDSLFGGWGHQWSTGELASMTIALGMIALPASHRMMSPTAPPTPLR